MRWLAVFVVLATSCGYDYLGRDVQVVYAPESDEAVLTVTGPIVTTRFFDSVLVIDLSSRLLVPIAAAFDEPSLEVRGPFVAATCVGGDYAFLILDNVRDAAADARIGRSLEFDEAFEGKGPFGSLRAALVQAGVELASVAGATLFTVSCP